MWFRAATGGRLDGMMFNSMAMRAGIRNPADLELGEQVMAAFIVGFAMQHNYLDSKIWRVSKHEKVRKIL